MVIRNLLLCIMILSSVFCKLDREDPVEGKNHFEIFGIEVKAYLSEDELGFVRQEYRRLARLYHPDLHTDEREVYNKIFEKINISYETLINDSSRHEYVQKLIGLSGRELVEAKPIKRDLAVELGDILGEREMKTTINVIRVCKKCSGRGSRSPSDISECHKCQGQGVIVKREDFGDFFVGYHRSQCHVCKGKGIIVEYACELCGGAMVSEKEIDVSVQLQRIHNDQDQVVIRNCGDEYPGTNIGSVVFVIKVLPHPVYEKKGHNLYVTEYISLYESIFGFERVFDDLEGDVFEISRKEKSTPNGYVEVLEECGLYRRDGERGTLYVRFIVKIPSMRDMSELEVIVKKIRVMSDVGEREDL